MADIVIDGTWEEVAEHGIKLAGKRVRLIVLKEQEGARGRQEVAGRGG